MSITDPGAFVVAPMLACERCGGERPHVAVSRWWRRCLACNRLRRADTGGADARLLAALALAAGALWLCWLAPLLAALVFIPAAVSAGLVLVLLRRAERREREQNRRAVEGGLIGEARPMTRAEREAWDRLSGGGSL